MKAYHYVDLHAKRQPNAEFGVCDGKRLTYGEARHVANRIARGILAAGVDRGDRIAVIATNSLDTVLIYQGGFKAGVVPTPINHRLTVSEWRDICNDAEAKLIFCDSAMADKLDPIRNQFSTVRKFIVRGPARLGWTNFDDWIAEAVPAPPEVVVSEDQVGLLVYTSGTTGNPRGVVITHRSISACIEQLQSVERFQPSDRFLLVMPLFHAAGIMVMLHAISGGASLLIQQRFVPTDVVNALDSEAVSVTMLVPTMIQSCLSEVPDISERNFSSLRLIIYGASPIEEQTLRTALSVFGCSFAQRYGSTETLCLTWLFPEEHHRALLDRPELLRSAGRPLPGVQIRVVDSEGKVMPPGEKGEFIASGPQVMREYWREDDGDFLEFEGQRWVRTGDAGFQDEEGYVFICDRVNDVIISGGENIYPHEIEAILLQHPSIQEAGVIGVPDAKWGEAIKAIVVPVANSKLSAEQLIEFCRDHVAGFKTPQSVDFVKSIPRNPSGKVRRIELRAPYWQGHQRGK